MIENNKGYVVLIVGTPFNLGKGEVTTKYFYAQDEEGVNNLLHMYKDGVGDNGTYSYATRPIEEMHLGTKYVSLEEEVLGGMFAGEWIRFVDDVATTPIAKTDREVTRGSLRREMKEEIEKNSKERESTVPTSEMIKRIKENTAEYQEEIDEHVEHIRNLEKENKYFREEIERLKKLNGIVEAQLTNQVIENAEKTNHALAKENEKLKTEVDKLNEQLEEIKEDNRVRLINFAKGYLEDMTDSGNIVELPNFEEVGAENESEKTKLKCYAYKKYLDGDYESEQIKEILFAIDGF